MSKGKIVDTGAVNLASGYLMLPVTSGMAPKAKVIVFYIRPDGEVVADGLSFNVEGIYKNEVGKYIIFCFSFIAFISRHTIEVGHYVFPFECPSVCPPGRLSALGFRSLAQMVFDGSYLNYAYTRVSRVSGFGLLMGKYRQFLTELSAHHTSVFFDSGRKLD